MSALKTNDYIGTYKILNKLGEGGMAMIYKALQPSLKRTVVIKNLKDPNREIISRFKKEALLSASFQQENLVAIYDFIYTNRSYYLVMEYVDGEDLRTIIDHLAPFPPNLAALIILGIARGLEYTHARNIIHRDIKPSNILLSHDGDVKLIDFGVAKDDVSTRLTLTGLIVGTPAYMSPEQANGDSLSAQSDIFALGILLYELLTGVKPFQGENNTEILARIVRNKYVPAELINPDVPFRLRRIIKKTLRKDPARRYRNSTEMIHDLENFIPWQLRSRRKEAVSRFIGKLNKTHTVSSTDSINLAIYSGLHSLSWRLLRFAFGGAVLFVLTFLFLQFSSNQLGYAKIDVNSPGYTLQIDGRDEQFPSQSNPVLGPFIKGNHTVSVTHTQSQDAFLARIPIKAGDTTVIKTRFDAVPWPANVTVSTEPTGASLFVDDYPLGQSTVIGVRLKAGRHRLTIKHEGYKTISAITDLNPARSYTLHYVLEADSLH